MATTEEIGKRALRRLGVLARNQSMSDEDGTEITTAYNELHAKLAKKKLNVWGDNTADVPDDFVDDVANLVAFSRVDEYSVPNDRYQRIAVKAQDAWPNITELAKTFSERATAEYF